MLPFGSYAGSYVSLRATISLGLLLVELALAERDSKNAGVFFFVCLPEWSAMVPGVPSGNRGTWD